MFFHLQPFSGASVTRGESQLMGIPVTPNHLPDWSASLPSSPHSARHTAAIALACPSAEVVSPTQSQSFLKSSESLLDPNIF